MPHIFSRFCQSESESLNVWQKLNFEIRLSMMKCENDKTSMQIDSRGLRELVWEAYEASPDSTFAITFLSSWEISPFFFLFRWQIIRKMLVIYALGVIEAKFWHLNYQPDLLLTLWSSIFSLFCWFCSNAENHDRKKLIFLLLPTLLAGFVDIQRQLKYNYESMLRPGGFQMTLH